MEIKTTEFKTLSFKKEKTKGWEAAGFMYAAKDFPNSSPQFRSIFSPGYYYRRINSNNGLHLYFKCPTGGSIADLAKGCHYTVIYTGNGKETRDEHFTYDRDKRIFVNRYSLDNTVRIYNAELKLLLDEYPGVENYFAPIYK